MRRAMLEHFGTSIRAEKARAGLYQLKQDNMTVLQYAAAFESFLAQLGDYDESYYLVHFISGLRPEIMRGVYIQQPDSLLAAKNMAERVELTHHLTVGHPMRTKKKRRPKPSIVAPRRGDQAGIISRRLAEQYRDRGRGGLQNQHSTEAAYPLV